MIVKDDEIPVFVKELKQLYDDYLRCPDDQLKITIIKDIDLVSRALSMK